jgi:hypothetical protein
MEGRVTGAADSPKSTIDATPRPTPAPQHQAHGSSLCARLCSTSCLARCATVGFFCFSLCAPGVPNTYYSATCASRSSSRASVVRSVASIHLCPSRSGWICSNRHDSIGSPVCWPKMTLYSDSCSEYL